mmetsp:Transcript_53570/g.88852  ORF Transcript_53570/g.88852 Transcript_53570/m.88852 type:complete len:525 (-) Transcript_53570:390-1964(-)
MVCMRTLCGMIRARILIHDEIPNGAGNVHFVGSLNARKHMLVHCQQLLVRQLLDVGIQNVEHDLVGGLCVGLQVCEVEIKHNLVGIKHPRLLLQIVAIHETRKVLRQVLRPLRPLCFDAVGNVQTPTSVHIVHDLGVVGEGEAVQATLVQLVLLAHLINLLQVEQFVLETHQISVLHTQAAVVAGGGIAFAFEGIQHIQLDLAQVCFFRKFVVTVIAHIVRIKLHALLVQRLCGPSRLNQKIVSLVQCETRRLGERIQQLHHFGGLTVRLVKRHQFFETPIPFVLLLLLQLLLYSAHLVLIITAIRATTSSRGASATSTRDNVFAEEILQIFWFWLESKEFVQQMNIVLETPLVQLVGKIPIVLLYTQRQHTILMLAQVCRHMLMTMCAMLRHNKQSMQTLEYLLPRAQHAILELYNLRIHTGATRTRHLQEQLLLWQLLMLLHLQLMLVLFVRVQLLNLRHEPRLQGKHEFDDASVVRRVHEQRAHVLQIKRWVTAHFAQHSECALECTTALSMRMMSVPAQL